MAMKPCRECKKDVSTDAKTCPHCGKANPTQAKISTGMGCLIVVVVLFIIGSLVNSGGSNSGEGAPTATAPSSTPAAPPLPAVGGRWAMSEDTSSIDDSRTVTLSLDADSPVAGWPSQTETPTLIIRCKEKKTNLYIVNGMSPNVEYGVDGATVTLRLDSAAAFSREWSKSTDGDALFAPSPVALARQLAKATKLVYRFTPFNSNPAETSFRLTGLADVLPKVAAACKWPA